MSDGRRSAIFERFMDDAELYFNMKREYDRKVRAAYETGNPEAYLAHWQEAEQIEDIRERARHALDEYVDSKPDPEPVEQA